MHFILRFHAHSYFSFDCLPPHTTLECILYTQWFSAFFPLLSFFLIFRFQFFSSLRSCVILVKCRTGKVSDWREKYVFYIETQHIYMLKTISHNWIDKTFRFHLFFFVRRIFHFRAFGSLTYSRCFQISRLFYSVKLYSRCVYKYVLVQRKYNIKC